MFVPRQKPLLEDRDGRDPRVVDAVIKVPGKAVVAVAIAVTVVIHNRHNGADPRPAPAPPGSVRVLEKALIAARKPDHARLLLLVPSLRRANCRSRFRPCVVSLNGVTLTSMVTVRMVSNASSLSYRAPW